MKITIIILILMATCGFLCRAEQTGEPPSNNARETEFPDENSLKKHLLELLVAVGYKPTATEGVWTHLRSGKPEKWRVYKIYIETPPQPDGLYIGIIVMERIVENPGQSAGRYLEHYLWNSRTHVWEPEQPAVIKSGSKD